MIFLLLNIAFGSAFMLLLKWAQMRQHGNIVTIGAINYITAALLVLPIYLNRQMQLNGPLGSSDWWRWSSSQQAAVICGVAMGSCYFTAYFFVIRAVRWVGASSTAVVGVLSILLPISFGIMVWGERPQQSQWLGMVVALVALLLIGWKREQTHSERPWFTPWVLLGFFLLAGLSRLSQEGFKYTSSPELRPLFLWSAFLAASIPSVVMLGFGGRRPTRKEWGIGTALGLSNILQTQFILQALQHFPGFVVFPLSSAGALVATTLAAMGWLHERPDRWTLIGIGLAVVAVGLLY
jgi:drug/metabolite transporter (DMT)-like permease